MKSISRITRVKSTVKKFRSLLKTFIQNMVQIKPVQKNAQLFGVINKTQRGKNFPKTSLRAFQLASNSGFVTGVDRSLQCFNCLNERGGPDRCSEHQLFVVLSESESLSAEGPCGPTTST
jgi:hypothetical protein